MYRMKSLIILTLCLFSFALQTQLDYPTKMIVNVPIADLRTYPKANDPNLTLPTSDLTNPFQVTQLLLGEHVIANKEYIDANNQKWLQVNTLQQQYYHLPIGWHGYPGWIQANQLIEVQNFAQHNLVVHSKLANIFDAHGHKICTLSIGTRLMGTEKINNAWTIMLPDNHVAHINDSDVYFISPIVQESCDQLQQKIIKTALSFVGDDYSWGGRSAQNDQIRISSVDCSALINLSFLAHGLQIPRMSHEQFLKSFKINECKDLQPCDLIFFSSITKQSTRMDHVMLYLGDDQILESTFADDHKVRIVSFQERMGKPCNTITSGDIIDWNNEEFYIYFGSFLQNYAKTQKLRDDALKHI